jgi:RHS repeat-associated protein
VNNAFGYNLKSEVTSATMGENAYNYNYDPIGNRIYAAFNAETNTYSANALNQYSSILSSASSAPLRETKPTYDMDGNMLTNGVWSYIWDAENRLTAVYSNNTLLVSNVYDHQSRRIAKNVFEITQSGTNAIRQFSFVYDAWNLIQEKLFTSNLSLSTFYTWGLDLSGSLQGAGGVGGLLAVQRDSAAFFPCFDANGNVTEYIDATGAIKAHYVFDAFGQTISQSGDLASTFSHRFSTKYADDETGLYYYGYRYYAPELGRWVNRDPIEEMGGANLYGFVGNIALNQWDYLGMLTREEYIGKIVWSAQTRYYATYWEAVIPFPVPRYSRYYKAVSQALSGEAYNRLENSSMPGLAAFNVSNWTIDRLTVYAKPKTIIEYDENNRLLYDPAIAIVTKGTSPDGKWEYPWRESPMILNAIIGTSPIGGPEIDPSPQAQIKKWSNYYLGVGSVGVYEIHRKILTCEGEDIVLPTLIFELKNMDIK